MESKRAIIVKGTVTRELLLGKYVRYMITLPKRRNEGEYPPELDALAGKTVTVIIVDDGE
jgi:hypothetical protein